MRGAIPLLPQYVFMAWCLVKHKDNFTFTLSENTLVHKCVDQYECDDVTELQTLLASKHYSTVYRDISLAKAVLFTKLCILF